MSEVPREAFQAYAEAFLVAGGHITLGDWADMPQWTREAFEAAGKSVEARRLSSLALALGLPEAAAKLLAAKDGGVSESYAGILRQMDEVTRGE